MNCVNHPETAATAYCRTCGKAMCERCARTVRGVVYCEDCIATRLHDAMPPGLPATTAVPAATSTPVVVTTSGPSPGLAGVLSAFFPFGVGAVYTGQYAKGLAHMLIFVCLIWGASSGGDVYGPFFGIAIAFFYVYQIIDSVRSAKAIQLGQPAPDPFGLGRAFGTGERPQFRRVPVGAIVLIGLGVIFLFNTMGWFQFYWIGRLWPLILIVMGVWLFAKRFGAPGAGGASSGQS